MLLAFIYPLKQGGQTTAHGLHLAPRHILTGPRWLVELVQQTTRELIYILCCLPKFYIFTILRYFVLTLLNQLIALYTTTVGLAWVVKLDISIIGHVSLGTVAEIHTDLMLGPQSTFKNHAWPCLPTLHSKAKRVCNSGCQFHTYHS